MKTKFVPLQRDVTMAGSTVSELTKKGSFKGYASVFGVRDSHGDVVMPGAFATNLNNWRRLKNWPKLLWQHDAAQPIGYITKLYEDAVGLVMEAQLLLELPKAREAYALLQNGVLDGLSIGYKVAQSYAAKQSLGRNLKQIDLFEVSLVTFPSNEIATVHDVKRLSNLCETTKLQRVFKKFRDALLVALFICMGGISYGSGDSEPEKRKHDAACVGAAESEQRQTKRLARGSDSDGSTSYERSTGRKQIYGNATYDALFKHVLSDLDICKDFIETFIPDIQIQDLERLDEHMHPVKNLENLRTLFARDETKKAFQDLQEAGLDAVSLDDSEAAKGHERSVLIVREVFAQLEDLREAFPSEKYNGTMDFVVSLNDQESALIEMQVLPGDNWDNRALAYAANLFSRQLKKGGKWRDLKKVIAINLLGGGRERHSHWADEDDQPIRHYKFQDQKKKGRKRFIDGIEIIQYAVMAQPKNEVSQKFKEWMSFFRDGYTMTETDVEQGIQTPAVLKAFERAKMDRIPERVRKGYDEEDKQYDNYTESIKRRFDEGVERGIQRGIEQGMEQGKRESSLNIARNLLRAGMTVERVVEATELEEVEVKAVLSDLKGGASQQN